MTNILNEEVALAVALPLFVAIVQVARSTRKRLYTSAKARCIARITQIVSTEKEPCDKEIQRLRRRYPSGIILDSATFIAEHIYGAVLHRLDAIMEECREERWRNNDIEGLIDLHADFAIRNIARLEEELTWHKAAQLVHLMRRSGTPLAYTPLLASHNRNLQLIGIYICELFSIADAEQHLQRLIKSEDCEVAYTALLTLCSIRGDISASHIGPTLQRIAPHQRTAFILHAVQCCYSLRSCAHLLSRDECTTFAQRIDSYKSEIVCN